jgi:hypothetical protein
MGTLYLFLLEKLERAWLGTNFSERFTGVGDLSWGHASESGRSDREGVRKD